MEQDLTKSKRVFQREYVAGSTAWGPEHVGHHFWTQKMHRFIRVRTESTWEQRMYGKKIWIIFSV